VHADEELVRHVARRWTVGELRAALQGLPDELPLVVHVAEEPGGDLVQDQVVIGAGFGTIDWGGERGEDVDRRFGIECDFPPGEYYRPRSR
jgi:hypothetical protein